VDVLENGVPTFMEAPSPRRGTQLPLSVYHIGGRSAHKGTTLIEGAFRQNAFPNLKLTMVDGALASGQRVVTHWGPNEVTLIGPVPQSAVAELYRSMDVLLAPSIWPESYGLVSREARHYGVWVVASNAGAMAGDIEDGTDGDIIPANSSAHLTAVLKRLNDHPDLALKGQPAQKPMRSMDQQAEDLAELYHALMTGRR
jgi:glycosyltransferase involved in cell wall biosynthesis